MDKSRLETAAFFGFFAIVSILLVMVFWPFVQILALAAVFAVLFRTPYEDLARDLKGYNSVAAAVIVALVFIFCIIPIFLLGSEIFREAQGLYASIGSGDTHYAQVIQTAIERPIQNIYPSFSFSLDDIVARTLSFVSANLGFLVSQTLYLILGTALMLLSFFFFLRDGSDMVQSIFNVSPFRREHTDEIIRKSRDTINSIIRGTLFVALVRLVCFSAAFYFFGIPNAILWGSIAGIVGAVPGLGTPFVVIPTVIFLYLDGQPWMAVGFLIFGIAVMALIDNLLTSYFFGRGLDVQPIFVIFSLLGGVSLFGPMGFVLGPLVLSLFLTMLHIYSLFLKQ